MSTKELPSPELLRQLLRYDPDTGKLYWKERTPDMFVDGKHSKEHTCSKWNSRHAHKEAFNTKTSCGYFRGSIMGVDIRAHRAAWALHFGDWPKNHIDHLNGNRVDNRIVNLKDVTISENNINRKIPSNNKSNFIGVWFDAQRGKWVAELSINKERILYKRFSSKDEAITTRKEAEAKYGFHPNHGRRQ